MNKKAQHRYEWIHHLWYENKTDKDLSFANHIPASKEDWIFPKPQKDYWDLVFAQAQHYINGKTVIDIGCGFGCWASGFESAKHYTGIDIDPNRIKYAKMVLDTLDLDYTTFTDTIQNLDIKADTVYMLSVNHRLKKESNVYDRLNCKYFVLDTWEFSPTMTVDEIILYLNKKGFDCVKKLLWKSGPIRELHYSSILPDCKLGGRRFILHFENQNDGINTL